VSARFAGRRTADGGALLLAIGGLVAAVAGQAVIVRQPWPAVAAFAVGALLFAWAARRAPVDAEREEMPPTPWPARVAIPWAVGVGLCLIAAVLVYRYAQPTTPHTLWVLGMIAIAAGATLAPAPPIRLAPLTTAQRGALVAIVVLAAVVFGWALTSIPAEVHGDDAEVGLDAIRLLENFNLFAAGWFELPRFHALPTAIGLRLFGVTLLGLRMTSALLGVAGVLLLFTVVRRLWSADLALLAALLLVGQRFWIHLSRTGYHYVDTPVVTLLVVWLLLRVWQDGRLGAALWCGIVLGLGIQTYYASRLVPPLLALTWLAWLPETPRSQRRERLLQLVVITVTALAVAAPLFGYFAHHWADFWLRNLPLPFPNAFVHWCWWRRQESFCPRFRYRISRSSATSTGLIIWCTTRKSSDLFGPTIRTRVL